MTRSLGSRVQIYTGRFCNRNRLNLKQGFCRWSFRWLKSKTRKFDGARGERRALKPVLRDLVELCHSPKKVWSDRNRNFGRWICEPETEGLSLKMVRYWINVKRFFCVRRLLMLQYDIFEENMAGFYQNKFRNRTKQSCAGSKKNPLLMKCWSSGQADPFQHQKMYQ